MKSTAQSNAREDAGSRTIAATLKSTWIGAHVPARLAEIAGKRSQGHSQHIRRSAGGTGDCLVVCLPSMMFDSDDNDDDLMF
mmetsp:Transcript_12225/g.23741  ORF Transcript_12225/g.23741 Transcript_12225/m.23741 type:complete len:82 (-) Transcript_12225:135-380(-)